LKYRTAQAKVAWADRYAQLLGWRPRGILPGMSTRAKQLWLRLGIVLGIWMALAFVLAGQAYLLVYSAIQARSDLAGVQPSLALSELFLNSLAECVIWACLTIVILWLGTRFPFGQGHLFRNLMIHLAACLVCAFVQTYLAVLICEIVRVELPKPTISGNVLFYYVVAKLNNNIFFYWAILAVSHILRYYRQFRDRELRSSQLEARLAETRLQILKMQLHPHFLFNTLNAISALIHQDVELADRMIARLGDLLRATLESASLQEVAFRQELDFIEPYLEIEKARLGPRLTVQMAIDPAALDASVPNLILQPLVENAIRHGVAPRAEPGRIEISARRDNGFLHLGVHDDGPGIAGTPPAEGIGLGNTRARLSQLYGTNHRLELTSGPQGGLCVDIAIPYREAAVAPAEEDA
jgi:signal transduction histidine kinase